MPTTAPLRTVAIVMRASATRREHTLLRAQ